MKNWRGKSMEPVRVQVPVAGLYSSALCWLCSKLPESQPYPLPLQPPPATSTWPPRRRVAVCPDRALVMEPVADQVPVLGL